MGKRTWIIFVAMAWAGCQQAVEGPGSGVPAVREGQGTKWMLLDFETANVPVVWTPRAAGTVPGMGSSGAGGGTRPGGVPPFVPLQRTSVRPQEGRWSAMMPVNGPGEVRLAPAKPMDLSGFDLLTVGVAQDDAARNGECVARLRVMDASGRAAVGDWYPVVEGWRTVGLDVRAAGRQGVALTRIAALSLEVERRGGGTGAVPLAVKTDAWAVETNARGYVGSSVGAAKTFFVEARGGSIHVGCVGQFEVAVEDRGDVGAGPWLRVFSGTPQREVLGQDGTGLYLLDATAMAQVAPRTTPDYQGVGEGSRVLPEEGRWAWPAALGGVPSTMHWEVVWSRPMGAILEGRQEAGGFDGLGKPVVTAIWRLMIYPSGQVFVDVRWEQTGRAGVTGTVSGPASWALISKGAAVGGGDENAERLLTEVYPATVRQGMQTALPHAMQSGAAVGMIAPLSGAKDNFWWAGDGGGRRVFGAGIVPVHPDTALPNMSEATCMVLVNAPTGLALAGAFGQYLAPAKIVVNQGEIDRTFPGNWDNDPYGFVETYGFQVVRLAGGRATFTIYPQERPVFYPPILFTVPAAEREGLDVKGSRLLVNIDGKVFTDAAVFPDGSFLLQVPYVIDRPVNVEARLVK